jgi:hypothetical protein
MHRRFFAQEDSMKHRIALIAGLLTALGAIFGVTATAAQAASDAGSPPVEAAAPAGSTFTITAEATYGILNGKAYYHLIKGELIGHYHPSIPRAASSEAPQAGATSCTEYIGNVSRSGRFHWYTSFRCNGVGINEVFSQMWRSSWSGPRGYSSWGYTGWTISNPVSDNWSIGCNNGHGYYDYYPVMYGDNAYVGQGPTIRSANQLNHVDCGPTVLRPLIESAARWSWSPDTARRIR